MIFDALLVYWLQGDHRFAPFLEGKLSEQRCLSAPGRWL